MKSMQENRLFLLPEIEQKILSSVWCGECKEAVTMVDYVGEGHKFGMLLKGKCKNCGHAVARLVEKV